MVGPTKHNAIDGGGFDSDERMLAIARHRQASPDGERLRELLVNREKRRLLKSLTLKGKVMENWKPDLVIYHDPCLDGFTAAWACWRRWPDAEYYGTNYGRVPIVADGKNVLIVDFSYKRPHIEAMAQTAKSIVILDHHKSALEDLEPFVFTEDVPGSVGPDFIPEMLRELAELNRPPIIALFDMERAGARMAWDFAIGTPPPPLVNLVEDRDLWTFAYGNTTRDLQLRLQVEPKEFGRWDAMHAELAVYGQANDVAGAMLIQEGRTMRTYRDWLVGVICERAKLESVGDYLVPCVDCPPELASEAGDLLCRQWPEQEFAALRRTDAGLISYSIRSRGGFDCQALAVRFGGGGHPGAAGFSIRTSDG